MATSNNSYKVDPLNGDNYVTWNRCLEWILDNLDLWDSTNGTEMMPEPVDPQAPTQAECNTINEWKTKDKKAQKEICLRISDEYLVYIDQNTTTPELGTRLQGIFQSKAAIGIVNLCREFSGLLPKTALIWSNTYVNYVGSTNNFT